MTHGIGVLLWDFDGTLARRKGMWHACLMETLELHEPGHSLDPDAVRAGLRDGFPWHRPDDPHPELCDPIAWWAHVEAMLAGAYLSAGISAGRANQLARLAHSRYIDTTEVWEVYPDTLPALRRLESLGWRHAILSNHVPELPEIVAGLGLAPHFEAVFTSAETGFEKPHPEAFARARGAPSEIPR